MTYFLESQADLVHPDRWNDFDIYDPFMFAMDTPNSAETKLAEAVCMFARTRLRQGLSRAMLQGSHEAQLRGIVGPDALSHGDIVILDHEQVRRQKVEDTLGCTRLLDDPALYAPLSQGIPITEPLVNFWHQSQKYPDNLLYGTERAYFEDGVVYQRRLEWGVYIEASNQRHAIVSTALNSCSRAGDNIEFRPNVRWHGKVLPLEVGQVSVKASRMEGEVATRSLQRIAQIRRVRTVW